MTCPKCRYNWCWMCRGRYYSGHFNTWNIFGCPGSMYQQYNACSLFFTKLLFILCIPFILFFGPIFMILSNMFSCQDDYGRCRLCSFKFLLFIFIGFPLGLAIGSVIGSVAIAVLLIPAWILQMFRLLKIIFRKTDFCCLCKKLRR